MATKDLAPTLLGLAGVSAPGGLSFLPGVIAALGGSGDERPIYSEAWQTRASALKRFEVLQPTFAVRVGHRKLIRYREPDGFRYVSYDLQRDPWELENAVDDPAHRDVLADLRLRLADWSIASEDATPVPLPEPGLNRP